MKTKNIITCNIIFIFLIFGSFALIDAADIKYPVEELESCQNQEECKTYCDKPENLKPCLDFAKANNLMSEAELQQAEKFLEVGAKGPGECSGKQECEEYCNDVAHIDECISFAEKNGLMPKEDLQEAKKVQSAIKRGIKMPACKNKKQCDVYCENPDNMEECVNFAIEAGFIEGKELEDAQKMLQAVKRGVKPPPCKGKEECDIYCQEEGHFEECVNFAAAAGFMSEEDTKMARKTKGKSPGNCRGKEECEAFCNNPDNQETCFNFAKEYELIPEQDLKKMEGGKEQMKQSLNQAPEEVLNCLKDQIGQEMFEKINSGGMPSRDVGDKMRVCFEKMSPQQGKQGEFQPGPGEINPGNQTMPPQSGPGGCKGPEECQKFCQENPDACNGFESKDKPIDLPQDFKPPEDFKPSESRAPLPQDQLLPETAPTSFNARNLFLNPDSLVASAILALISLLTGK